MYNKLTTRLEGMNHRQGRQQKNFQGGQRKKDRKIAKKTENNTIKSVQVGGNGKTTEK